jgi:hypothetical protein
VKANHGKVGEEIGIRWNDGVYDLDNGPYPVLAKMLNKTADDVFMAVFTKLTAQGQATSNDCAAKCCGPSEHHNRRDMRPCHARGVRGRVVRYLRLTHRVPDAVSSSQGEQLWLVTL